MPLIPYFGSYAFATVTILCAANEFYHFENWLFWFSRASRRRQGRWILPTKCQTIIRKIFHLLICIFSLGKMSTNSCEEKATSFNKNNMNLFEIRIPYPMMSLVFQTFHKPQGPTLVSWEQVELDPRRCKTSLVGQSTGLSVPRSPVRFQQKLQKSRSQIYTWAHRASNKATRLFKQHWSILTSRGSWGGGVQGHFWPCHGQKIRSKSITFGHVMAKK